MLGLVGAGGAAAGGVAVHAILKAWTVASETTPTIIALGGRVGALLFREVGSEEFSEELLAELFVFAGASRFLDWGSSGDGCGLVLGEVLILF